MMHLSRITLALCVVSLIVGCGGGSSTAPSSSGSELEQYLQENPDIANAEYEEETLE